MVKAADIPWQTERVHRNVFVLRCPLSKANSWEQWFLLSSDRHWDNPDSNHKMQKRHLEEAMSRRAGILDFGDLFCAMQGKYDPRSSKRNIRPEHNVENYLDSLVFTATDFFSPYARNWIVAGMGNHETSILKRAETNLSERFVAMMNSRGGKLHLGGYTGWVKFHFQRGNRWSQTVNLHYQHGYGGGGPVTKGVIQANRRAVTYPDAHIIVSGHVHERWMVDHERSRISDGGKPYVDTQRHVCLPTYKEEYGDGWGGFHVEGGRPPKPNGAAWLVFWYSRQDERVRYKIEWAE